MMKGSDSSVFRVPCSAFEEFEGFEEFEEFEEFEGFEEFEVD